jgi:hypothetical protein
MFPHLSCSQMFDIHIPNCNDDITNARIEPSTDQQGRVVPLNGSHHSRTHLHSNIFNPLHCHRTIAVDLTPNPILELAFESDEAIVRNLGRKELRLSFFHLRDSMVIGFSLCWWECWCGGLVCAWCRSCVVSEKTPTP